MSIVSFEKIFAVCKVSCSPSFPADKIFPCESFNCAGEAVFTTCGEGLLHT